tara:strand:- start:2464 stop:3186 length:723 start_codon:yes stop_codon:yes gene_type:complete
MSKIINIASYLDSTYLKTANESNISELANKECVIKIINDAIVDDFACVMIRPEFVSIARDIIEAKDSRLKVGTVIDFPLGSSDTLGKIEEAKKAILDGAYDIDYVCDYNAFKRGSLDKFDQDILEGTKLVLKNKGVVKWIIETGALSREEIRGISKRITSLVESNFYKNSNQIFIKTSTGYYGGFGATIKDVKLIKSVSGNLKIKASGGVSTLKDCLKMIDAGADRIGTSKAQSIINTNT